ncbi:four helix bundle protein [Puniceicoccus vermicola]|uniref:four helix bundle protein n=1 Tax=Puniceicoccus vermicola TaxID=388746 RepID=UPI001C8CD2B3
MSKLTDSDGENQETRHWIHTAKDCGYISEKEADELIEASRHIGRMLGTMIAKHHLFCKKHS